MNAGPESNSFLAEGGAMGARIRAYDWAATDFGPPQAWPQSLRSALSVCLNSAMPGAIYWGPDYRLLYNDAYSEILVDRHPRALGEKFKDVWPEAWPALGPQLAGVVSTGKGFAADRFPLMLQRQGELQETHWFYSFAPIRGEGGAVLGVFVNGLEITADVLAERRSIAERDRLAQLFESAPSFVTTVRGPEHVFEFANAAFRTLVGERDLIGKTAREALPELEDQGFHKLLDRVYSSGERFIANRVCVRLEKPGGGPEERFLNFIYEPVRDDDGQITAIFVEGYDITEMQRAEASLLDAQERYLALFNAIDQGFCTIEVAFDQNNHPLDYRFLEVSPSFERQTGIKNGAGRWMREIAVDQDQFWFDTYGRVALTGEPARFENYSTPLGRWWDVYAFRISGPRRVALLFRDITEQKRAEASLRDLNETLEQRVAEALAERRTFAQIIESTAAAVLACDLEFGILAINAGTVAEMERVYGVRPQVGDNLLGLFSAMPEHRVQIEHHWRRALAGEEFVAVDEFGDPGRERAHYELRFGPLLDRDGRRIGAYQTAYDVTERVRAQAELAAAQEALRQSQKMEAMGQLTGGVAHDFNNLLTPIVGGLDILQRRGVGGQREQRIIDGALQSAERAKTLVQRLLAFARRQPLQSGAVDVARLIEGMADLVSSTAGPQVRVVVETEDELPAAEADPNQVEMALLNLCVNARDAMPDGGVLRISAVRETVAGPHPAGLAQGDYIRLSVADTGVGMDDATRMRAIEPFFSTKGVGKGTGLGLSMAHGLATQLGGALTIHSEPGFGTNVEFWLLVSRAAVPTGGQSAGQAVVEDRRGTALLVDDEDLVRASTAEMLIELGYRVEEASSAEAALEALRRGLNADLLITDHLMPGMNGTDLAREARNLRPGIRVLIVSGYAEAEGIDPDLPRLTKPFRNAELVASLAGL